MCQANHDTSEGQLMENVEGDTFLTQTLPPCHGCSQRNETKKRTMSYGYAHDGKTNQQHAVRISCNPIHSIT